jgi:DNA-binding transcriptional regulator GbsR (MarR family)
MFMKNNVEVAPIKEILERIQEQENSWLAIAPEEEKKKFKITYDTNIFYLRMLNYAVENGEVCPEGLFIRLTIAEMVKILGYSGGKTQKSISSLSKCGIIRRTDDSGIEAPATRIPATTILKKEFYEKR